MIDINNVTKIYKKGTERFTALEDVSFRIGKGDYAAITGSSGAGKSTLLYTIGGLIHPDSGTVMFMGEDLYGQNEKFLNSYRKRKVGFVFQQFHLMPYLTVFENIKLNNHRKSDTRTIEYYLEKCSITGLRNKYPSELSVGEKQRTAFIRAVISDPEVLLADEPTGNLDPENSSVIMQLIKEYNDKGGTIVLVSHNPEATKNANLVVTLERGRIRS
jgi:putative ABC transport system ATP-binding protein